MPGKPVELPPEVARSFAKDMRAYRATKDSIKRDEIAARQALLLSEHLGPREKKLRVIDVKRIPPLRAVLFEERERCRS